MVQRVTYTGRLEDDGTEVVCRGVQGARGAQGTLYTGQIEARMGVEAKDIGPAIPIGRDRYHSWSYFFKFSKQKVFALEAPRILSVRWHYRHHPRYPLPALPLRCAGPPLHLPGQTQAQEEVEGE